MRGHGVKELADAQGRHFGSTDSEYNTSSLLSNTHLLASFLSWGIAQGAKPLTYWIETRKVNLMRALGSGGMPSSHTAMMAGLTSAVGVSSGLGSPLFALCLVLLLIVAYDATSVRREAGKHAVILNYIMDRVPELHDADAVLHPEDGELKVHLGHTPAQVAAGFVLGTIVGGAVQTWSGTRY